VPGVRSSTVLVPSSYFFCSASRYLWAKSSATSAKAQPLFFEDST
jgi:hypothetical protein